MKEFGVIGRKAWGSLIVWVVGTVLVATNIVPAAFTEWSTFSLFLLGIFAGGNVFDKLVNGMKVNKG